MVWLAILKHAPAVLSAAEALFNRAKTSGADAASRASAELTQDMAKQLAALAMAQHATARTVRAAIGISIAAAVVAVAAAVIAFVR